MEETHLHRAHTFSLLILTFSLFSTLSLSTFSPTDNHLISCGSTVDTTVDNRRFISDSYADSPLLSSEQTTPLTNQNPSPYSIQIYNSARLFKKPSKYAFEIKEPGTHMVRLHFHAFLSSNLDLSDAQFHVLVNGYVALSNFSVGKVRETVVKEYFIWADSDKVVINFVPAKKGNYGFVNAIEVISAPKDLIADVGISLGLIHFNVYVNGYLAYEDLDLSSITDTLASPFYVDFVSADDSSGVLRVSVGPTNKTMAYGVDGILNGVEIMKMNNSVGSLDGKICAGMVLKSWPRGNIGALVPIVAGVCLFLSLAALMHRRTVGRSNPAAWSKLPTEVPGVGSNHGNQHLSGKA
ncbi:hypothetical protein OIU76_005772 [Salix suchowensis]|uniref:Malectin-like domain-containing protein n=1 Tax=Salix suchowensis TaxID=1278906 RepID=A0ABQ9A942_9ROSI|nr:hypothetical protein OIU77_010381 [Salix suchowensis]KAJ6344107.1 hypothetical protein OIU76_005772 [Salix suchowensis]